MKLVAVVKNAVWLRNERGGGVKRPAPSKGAPVKRRGPSRSTKVDPKKPQPRLNRSRMKKAMSRFASRRKRK